MVSVRPDSFLAHLILPRGQLLDQQALGAPSSRRPRIKQI